MSMMSTTSLMKKARAYKARVRAPLIKGPIRRRTQELKFVDLAVSNYACDTAGSVTALNLVAVGDDYNSRDGRQVTIKSVQLRGLILPQDQNTLNTFARVMLVWDNAANGTLATIAQILTAATSNSFPLVDNAHRFTVLMDRSFAVGRNQDTATQAYSNSPNVHTLEFYRKMDSVAQYSGTAANIASVQNGALLLVTIGNSGAGQGANFEAATRVRFTDS